MNFLNNLFGKKQEPIKSYEDFWKWFQANEQAFFDAVKNEKGIERVFFNQLSPKLDELKDGFYFLTGMFDDHTAELILTADGAVKNIVFIEELVQSAPALERWKFTALKPALDISDVLIEMDGYGFGSENLSFYPVDNENYPDEIDIVAVHHDYREEDKLTITNGIYIFLDNYLGELNFATTIDNLKIASSDEAEKELIPIAKLKDYLIWREKEFVEKYNGLRYDTENDSHSILEAELPSGRSLIAVVNTELLKWDGKASHPWILNVELGYDGDGNGGMPDGAAFELLGTFEDDILEELKDDDGYLNLGRQTADNSREIYIACKDFRKPSKVMHEIEKKYAGKFEISYEIYKDKYWQSLERFKQDF